MAAPGNTIGSSRLGRLARAGGARTNGERGASPEEAAARAEAQEEQCDLCGVPIGSEHRHLLDTRERRLMCCCDACKVLFDRSAASAGHYRLVPDRRLLIEGFRLDDPAWEGLGLPVDMAFFFRNTELRRVVAFYPSPAGATESQLELRSWEEIEEQNPVLDELEPDVEALLVNRAKGARDHWIVPIDDCYDLVGLMRTRWKGLSGGQEVWEELRRFFERLASRAKAVNRTGTIIDRSEPVASAAGSGEEATWRT